MCIYNYITPNLLKYESYEELNNKRNIFKGLFDFYSDKEKLSFQDVFLLKRTVILAEPGYGKTRLLKEIVIKAPDYGKHAIYLDLKKVNCCIEDYITKNKDTAEIVDMYINESIIQDSLLLKTVGFHLVNTIENIVCLDALDEVKQEKFSEVIEYIKEFVKKYPNVNIVISCRSHHFSKQKNIFENLDFLFVEMYQFSKKQVEKYLENCNVKNEDVNTIFDNLEQSGRELMIQTPRYLNILTTFIAEKGIEHILNITKIDLIEWFVYKELDNEDEICKKKEIIQRVLEKLALIMEIYQTNIITKDELMTFFDDVKSDLKITFLQQVDITLFFKRCLLKDNGDTLEFFNTEFQECLAAKEMLRLGKVDQIVFDLAIDQELGEFYISWFNTLHFLVNREPKLLTPILNYMSKKNNLVQDEYYHELLTSVNAGQLSITERRQVFERVFGYYQQVLNWIGYKVAENLARFYDKSFSEILKRHIDGKSNKGTQRFVKRGNVALLVEFLIRKGVLEGGELEYWKNKLIIFLKDRRCCNSVLQRLSLSALAWYKDIKLLKQVEKYIDLTDDLARQEFLTACKEANANDEFSIRQFVKGIKEGENIYSRYGLYEVKEKKAVKLLLEYFIGDDRLLNNFLDHESIFEKKQDDVIMQNIKYVWDEEICRMAKSMVISAYSIENRWITEESRFIKSLITLLDGFNPNYVFGLIKEIKNSKNLCETLYSFVDVFSILLKKGQVERFYIDLASTDKGKTIAFFTLKEIKYSRRPDAEEIYEEGREFFKEDYEELEKRSNTIAPSKSGTEKVYNKFKNALWGEENNYNLNIFGFYNIHKKSINEHITMKDKKKLKEIAIQQVFEKFDPIEGEIHFNKKDMDGGYTISVSLENFRECLKLVNELDIDIFKYRQKIINYIPFAYHELLETIFLLIKKPSNQEIKLLLQNYSGKQKDDRKVFRPGSLIETCDKYEIIDASEILREFIINDKIPEYDRIRAIEVSTRFSPDEDFLIILFNKYNGDIGISNLAEKANDLLINRFMNDEAIIWRIEEIKRRVFSFIEKKGVHSCNNNEIELHEKKFAKPLMNIKDQKYISTFLDLLRVSFDFYGQKEDYRSYASYLWEIVAGYYDNLKEYRSYKPILELEKEIHNLLITKEGVNWFLHRIKELKRSYLNYIGKPQNISDCIKKYNKLKQNQYLDISSSQDLLETIINTIEKDITKWVEEEGAYKFICEAKGQQEDLIQKTLKTQLENSLLRKGLRGVDIRREEQLLDGKEVDYLISYGFLGPILIELKRTDREEIRNDKERQNYKKKLLQYIDGTKSYKGIFLIFQIKEEYSVDIYMPKVLEIYECCDKVIVKALNCIKSISK